MDVRCHDSRGPARGGEEDEDLQQRVLQPLEDGGQQLADQLGHDAEVGDDLDLGAPEEEEELALQEDKTANTGHGPGKQVKDGNGHPTGRWLKEDEEESLEEADEEELAEVLDDEEVVNEVLRRVVARLTKKK